MNRATVVLAVLCILKSTIAGSAEKFTPDSKGASLKKEVPVEPAVENVQEASRRPEFRTARAEDAKSPYSNAGVMTTFIDFDNADTGEQLGYLLWAELNALLRPPPANDSVDLLALQSVAGGKYELKQDYHVAALAIARDFASPLTFWGAIKANDHILQYNAFLTLQPELAETDLVLSVALDADPSTRYEAGLTRTRYEFTGNIRQLESLFERNLVVRVDAPLFAAPSQASKRLATLSPGDALKAQKISGPWFGVRTADGQQGYVDIAQLQVLPRAVTISGKDASPRKEPATHFPATATKLSAGHYPLLGLEHDAQGGVWYRVSADGAESWVSGEAATPDLSLPVMHFLAGVYFYRASESQYKCHYRRAAAHFSQFISDAADTEKNTNLAAAHQLYAGAMLLSDETCGRADEQALQAYSRAIDLTPYDPTAYSLQAVADIGQNQLSAAALESLTASLDLDALDPVAAGLVLSLHGAVRSGALQPGPNVAHQLDTLYRAATREQVVRHMARIRQGPHVPLDTLGRTLPPIVQPEALLTFLNRSQADLVVYLANSDRSDNSAAFHQISLPNGMETDLRIPAGTYDIAVEAPTSDVKSIYGRHTYDSSSHHALDFFVRLNDAPITAP